MSDGPPKDAPGSGNTDGPPADPPAAAHRPRGRRPLWPWVVLGVLALSLGAAAFSWLVVAYPAPRGPGGGRVVEVALSADADLHDLRLVVGRNLLVRRPRLFWLYAWVMGASGRLREGPVLVRDDMSPRQLLQRLARGYGATELRITFPEGLTRFGVAERLERWGVCSASEFVAATQDPDLLRELGLTGGSAEGYLFPDTYRIRDDATPRSLVRRLVKTAQTRLSALAQRGAADLSNLRTDLRFDLHAVVTLASVVEKEAAVADEQATIAGVFLNRLRDPAFSPRRLQADPTVAYGCLEQPALASCANFDGRRVTRKMTADVANRYNTYRHAGLPPGPIANPGMGALRAVLNPGQHGYFYFVARGAGRHRFSETLADHNRAVQAYREGR